MLTRHTFEVFDEGIVHGKVWDVDGDNKYTKWVSQHASLWADGDHFDVDESYWSNKTKTRISPEMKQNCVSRSFLCGKEHKLLEVFIFPFYGHFLKPCFVPRHILCSLIAAFDQRYLMPTLRGTTRVDTSALGYTT